MFSSRALHIHRLLSPFVVACIYGGMLVSAAPPIWWSQGNPPVINPNAAVNDYGVANIGQAKWMARQALEALNARRPDLAAQVEAELVGENKPLASWDVPSTPEQKAQQGQSLLLGQLKAIAAPFYDKLHAAEPAWLAAQVTENGIPNTGSHYPWTTATTDDANRAMATIGQLKAVFSLRFESLSQILEAPTLALGGTTASTVSLTWNDVPTEAGYRVEYSTDKINYSVAATLGANVTSYVHSPLTQNTDYYYRVVSLYAQQQESVPSNVVLATTSYAPPGAPSNLAISNITAHGFQTTWSAGGTNQVYYLIQGSADGGATWGDLANSPNGQTTALVSNLSEKTNYLVRIAAYNPAATAYSSSVSATTLPYTPAIAQDLAITSASATTAALSWTDTANNETGFRVEQSVNGGSWSALATVSANSTSYAVTGLTGSSSYRFRVFTINSTIASEASNQVDLPAMPLAPTSVTTTAQGWNAMKVNWSLPTDTSRTAVKLRSFKSGESNARVLVDLGNSATSYTDQGLLATTSYTYQISTLNLRGETFASTAAVTTPSNVPSAPTVSLTVLGPRSIQVNWTSNSSVEDGFRVGRSKTGTGGPWTVLADLPSNASTFTDSSGLQGSTQYHYRVKIYNGYGSAYSPVVAATTSAYPATNKAPDAVSITPLGLVNYNVRVDVPGMLYFENDVTCAKLSSNYWVVPINYTVNNVVYRYAGVLDVTTNQLIAALAPDVLDANEEFANRVLVLGNRIFISATAALKTSGNTATARCGAVYVFDWNGSAASLVARIRPDDGEVGDRFGESIAVDTDRIIIGASGKDVSIAGTPYADAGKVYLYDRATAGTWNLTKTEVPVLPEANLQFGKSVALQGSRFVVGAPNQDDSYAILLNNNLYIGSLVDAGALYFGKWTAPAGGLAGMGNPMKAEIASVDLASLSGMAGSHFGAAVTMDSNLGIVVTAPDHTWSSSNTAMSPYNEGSVFKMYWNGELGDGWVCYPIRIPISLGIFDQKIGLTAKWDAADQICYLTSGSGSQTRSIFLRMAVGNEIGTKVAELKGHDPDDDPVTYSVVTGASSIPSFFGISGTTPLPAGADKFEVLKDSSGVSYLASKPNSGLATGAVYSVGVRVLDDRGGLKDFNTLVQIGGQSTMVDADNDGMDDNWENAHGLNPNDATDASRSTSGDGLSAKDKYLRYRAGMSFGVDPNKWDLDPNGDEDRDGVLNKMDADPFDPLVTVLTIQILQPGAGENL